MTWTTIADQPLVLVPVGSTEQHGPHLPLDTDSIIAGAVAAGVAERIRLARPESTVLVAPTIPYGASGEHQAFPGTVSIGHDALAQVIVELVRSLSTWAEQIVVVNGHGGNAPTLARAVPQLVAESHDVGWVPCAVRGGDAHAGRIETSVMLHLRPALVRPITGHPGNAAPIASLMARLRAEGVQAVSPSGILGDPDGASALEGASLLNEMVESICRRIDAHIVDERGCLRDPLPRDRPAAAGVRAEPGIR